MTDSHLEFSRLVNIPLQALENKSLHLKATILECQRLAERFGLVSLKNFEITLFFLPISQPKTYPLKAIFSAGVTYTCVKTLEPFDSHVKETVYFTAQEHAVLKQEKNIEDLVLTGEEETIEPLNVDGFLDVGEVMAQYLSLALDPYPSTLKIHNLENAPKSLNRSNTNIIHEEKSEKTNTYFPFKDLSILKNKKEPLKDH